MHFVKSKIAAAQQSFSSSQPWPVSEHCVPGLDSRSPSYGLSQLESQGKYVFAPLSFRVVGSLVRVLFSRGERDQSPKEEFRARC